MTSYSSLLLAYFVGGVTFLPLLVGAILLHAYLTFPTRLEDSDDGGGRSRRDTRESASKESDRAELDNLPDELKPRTHEPDVASGYFAVARDYDPQTVRGKPVEKASAAGNGAPPSESPSVYQTMYRSLFDRTKQQPALMDSAKSSNRKNKNTFYVVLRLGHLMLYDDSEQLEVRHVISLEHHNVDVYSGGERIPEGELWIKRTCIRLSKRRPIDDVTADSRPFFLFSDNQSEKEDFYHALLANQEQRPGNAQCPPTPLKISADHVVKLVRLLHSSEENISTRWLNAFIGRVFLAVYKTPTIENFVRMKVTKKIARVRTPAFIHSIKIQKVDMGDSAPVLARPKLRELTVDGDLTIEADCRYQGNFRLEVSAIARIELGARFRTREVTLVLAGILKHLEGHVLIRVKPPPSNRVWFSFETMPKIEMNLEPIVSSRQITYGVILRALESRIREVIGETLVQPNWDDLPFLDTMYQRFRGGIWEDDTMVKQSSNPATVAAQQGLVDEVASYERDKDDGRPASASSQVGFQFMSDVKEDQVQRDELERQEAKLRKVTPTKIPSPVSSDPALSQRRGLKAAKSSSSLSDTDVAVASGAEKNAVPSQRHSTGPSRSYSFSSAAHPVLSTDSATHEAKGSVAGSATAAMRDITGRSQTSSPSEAPAGSTEGEANMSLWEGSNQQRSKTAHAADESQNSTSFSRRRGKQHSRDSESMSSGSGGQVSRSSTVSSIKSDARRLSLNRPIATAANVAKRWTLGALTRNQAGSGQGVRSASPTSTLTEGGASANTEGPAEGVSDNDPPSSSVVKSGNPAASSAAASLAWSAKSGQAASLGSPSNPMGRGQPLPPPGQPLPGPKPANKSTWPLSSLTKRKPVSSLREQAQQAQQAHSEAQQGPSEPSSHTPLPRTRTPSRIPSPVTKDSSSNASSPSTTSLNSLTAPAPAVVSSRSVSATVNDRNPSAERPSLLPRSASGSSSSQLHNTQQRSNSPSSRAESLTPSGSVRGRRLRHTSGLVSSAAVAGTTTTSASVPDLETETFGDDDVLAASTSSNRSLRPTKHALTSPSTSSVPAAALTTTPKQVSQTASRVTPASRTKASAPLTPGAAVSSSTRSSRRKPPSQTPSRRESSRYDGDDDDEGDGDDDDNDDHDGLFIVAAPDADAEAEDADADVHVGKEKNSSSSPGASPTVQTHSSSAADVAYGSNVDVDDEDEEAEQIPEDDRPLTAHRLRAASTPRRPGIDADDKNNGDNVDVEAEVEEEKQKIPDPNADAGSLRMLEALDAR